MKEGRRRSQSERADEVQPSFTDSARRRATPGPAGLGFSPRAGRGQADSPDERGFQAQAGAELLHWFLALARPAFRRRVATRKSHLESGQGSSPLIPMRVHVGPRPAQMPGNEAGESRRVKPKGSPSHPGVPGQGKTGRANVSEPPSRLRYERSSQPMAEAAMSGRGPVSSSYRADGHPGPAVQEAPAPVAPPRVRNAVTPLRSGPRASKPDDLRKDGPSPQREQDGPRSEGHRPKGKGNP